MNAHANKTQKNKSQAVANGLSKQQSNGISTFQFVNNRPETIAQRKLQEIANNSSKVSQLKAYQKMADNYSTKQKQLSSGTVINDTLQLIQIGENLNPQDHAFFNTANFQFATIEAGRTPSYYFSDGENWRRLRTQHRDGPSLIRARPRQQFFFSTQAELNAMGAHVASTGSPIGFEGAQLEAAQQDAFHGEFSPGSGTFHRSGGTIDLSAAPSATDLAAMTTALEQAPHEIQQTDSAVQLKNTYKK